QQLLCLEKPGLRPLELQFIGLESDRHAQLDRELRFWGHALLGDRFSWVPHGSRRDALLAMGHANVAVICSRQETFSMVAVEAMALGQPLLRNRCGGWQEQLEAGINGFDLGEPGPDPLPDQVQLLQRLRDPKLISAAQLESLSIKARNRAQQLAKSDYSDWLLP
ncbi:glycosyltransferase, partial [Synechococcus sp. UW140]|uniref:glycosyltransferase n=1 Tax=Synechococcus sp. UW140 TaxID=368503 RepID=UPI0025FF664B